MGIPWAPPRVSGLGFRVCCDREQEARHRLIFKKWVLGIRQLLERTQNGLGLRGLKSPGFGVFLCSKRLDK